MKNGECRIKSEKCLFKGEILFFLSMRAHAKFQIPRTPSGRKVKFTPKYSIVGGEGGVSEICLRLQFTSFGN